ncbi:hypothetical protein ACFMKY_18105 [Pseudomonas protegens]|uniref:hypothetical protein n=1 Tax=Pseudomonas protegens TaxID=380021 RepID=UPI00366F5A02
MPTETQHLEQRVAALQSDLNERDQRTDDLQFQLKDREGSHRDWFEAAQAAEKRVEELKADIRFLRSELRIANDTAALGVKMLAERDALLRAIAELPGVRAMQPGVIFDRIKAALSAGAEPSAPKCHCDMRTKLVGDGCAVCNPGLATDLQEPSAPVERDERAEFEQAFVVQEGVFFSKERNEYRSMNGRSIEYTDATDLNLRLQGWQARAALDKATEGASHE